MSSQQLPRSDKGQKWASSSRVARLMHPGCGECSQGGASPHGEGEHLLGSQYQEAQEATGQ